MSLLAKHPGMTILSYSLCALHILYMLIIFLGIFYLEKPNMCMVHTALISWVQTNSCITWKYKNFNTYDTMLCKIIWKRPQITFCTFGNFRRSMPLDHPKSKLWLPLLIPPRITSVHTFTFTSIHPWKMLCKNSIHMQLLQYEYSYSVQMGLRLCLRRGYTPKHIHAQGSNGV